jgi:two-component system, cell cycle response regulator DivK
MLVFAARPSRGRAFARQQPMAYLFDTTGVPRLLDDAEQLVREASAQERDLTALVASIEDSTAIATAGAGAGLSDGGPWGSDALGSIRRLSEGAGDQRRRAAALVTRLIGRSDGDGTQLRALIVDDGPDNREVAAATLEACGFEVIAAANGLDGIIAAHCARPAVILMDITMPVLDGLEATRLLKASEATKAINVIAHTAEHSFFQKAFASLFVAVLAKPTDPQELITLIQRFATA